MTKEYMSKCCGAEVYGHHGYSWGYSWKLNKYTCLKCEKPCEVVEKEEK